MKQNESEPQQGTVMATRNFIVEWGECDPLGIIFYPTYFRWIDVSSHTLFALVGHDMRTLRSTYGLEGPVIVDAGAKFMRPVSYGDTVHATAWIGQWNEKTFRVEHRFTSAGERVCTGHELRAWALPDETSPTGIKAAAIPQAFKDLFIA